MQNKQKKLKNNHICERIILYILHAQDEKKKVDFVYDINFEMNFDNREFYRSAFSRSMTIMTLYAGIFPRRNMADRYSDAFFSDSLKFYDNNLEGILLKFKRPDAEFEAGCDRMGQYSENQRERFMILTSGEGQVAPVMAIGYAGYM